MPSAATDRRTAILTGLVLLQLFASAGVARGGSGPTDEGLGLPSNFLEAPAELAIAKRRSAKDTEKWTLTYVGTLAAGVDSNVHESPDDTQASAIGGFGARVEALKYTGRAHRFKIAAEATGIPQAESSDESPYSQDLYFFYAFEPDRTWTLTTYGHAEHHDGSATTIDGDELDRDLEYFGYQSTNGLKCDFTRHQAARLSYTIEGRDYDETSGMPSIDWWKHGPRVTYEIEPSDSLQMEAFYSFAAQYYFDDPATLASGAQLPSNPEEKHFFHKTGAAMKWTLWDAVPMSVSYDYKVKDDRFQDFESYSGHTVELDAEWAPSTRWLVQTAGRFGHRDFDERPASDGGTLEYDRWTAYLAISYRMTHHMTVFIDYELDDRDSNRSADFSTFRDYVRHRAMVGWSIAY